jgi:selenoprotein W-related protein
LAQRIESRTRVNKVDLIPSSGGVFEIKVDGVLVFSKKATNRFPDESEIEVILSK